MRWEWSDSSFFARAHGCIRIIFFFWFLRLFPGAGPVLCHEDDSYDGMGIYRDAHSCGCKRKRASAYMGVHRYFCKAVWIFVGDGISKFRACYADCGINIFDVLGKCSPLFHYNCMCYRWRREIGIVMRFEILYYILCRNSFEEHLVLSKFIWKYRIVSLKEDSFHKFAQIFKLMIRNVKIFWRNYKIVCFYGL